MNKTQSLRALIVDDELHCRESLRYLLTLHCPQIEIVKECRGVEESVKALFDYPVDILFLDVMLQKGTGFDILEQTHDIPYHTIFTTAHDEYAIRAIKFSALDYLLKPICADDLIKAVSRAFQASGSHKVRLHQLNTLHSHLNAHLSAPVMIALPTIDGLTFIEVQTIVKCEAQSNYTIVSTSKKENLTVCRTLKEFEELLQGYDFFRIHHASLINLHHLKKYMRGKGGYVILSDGSEVEVSVRKKEEFFERMKDVVF